MRGRTGRCAGRSVGAIENTRKGHTITYAERRWRERTPVGLDFGAEILALSLYTQTGATQAEATRQATETQAGSAPTGRPRGCCLTVVGGIV